MAEEKPREIKVHKENFSILKKLRGFYDSQYKLLLLIPFLILIFGFVSIGYKYYSEGDFINRDVTLKGGATLTITLEKEVDIKDLQSRLESLFPDNDLEVRSITEFGKQAGILILADIEDSSLLDSFKEEISKVIDLELTNKNLSVGQASGTLGMSFFQDVTRALLIAFIFMGGVVFFYFGPNLRLKFLTFTLALVSSIFLFLNMNIVLDIVAILIAFAMIYIFIKWSIPSFAVILAALSDIVVTLAIVNLLNIKLSDAGVAAFLMLIGYSVDTDILLSTRVLKNKAGTVLERIFSAAKTGLTMTTTTLAALTVALLFTQSQVIKQIMLILLIGLFVDLINTWIQNAGILRLYLEKKK